MSLRGVGGSGGWMQEAIRNIHSFCFVFSALKLTIRLFVEYIERHETLMTPQHA